MAAGMAPDESTPLLMHAGSGHASLRRTMGNIFISIVGAGVLGLPYTFRTSGWAVSASSVTIAACLTYYCMLLLVSLFTLSLSLSCAFAIVAHLIPFEFVSFTKTRMLRVGRVVSAVAPLRTFIELI